MAAFFLIAELVMLEQIISHTPTWVWVVLAVFLYRGIVALQDREVPLKKVILLPLLMLFLSLHGLIGLVHSNPLALGMAALAMLAGIALAWVSTARSVTVCPHGLLLLRGSMTPLLMMIGIFTVKYGVAVTQAMHPEVLQATLPALVLGLIYGMFAGRSLGRVLRVLHLCRQAEGATAPLGT